MTHAGKKTMGLILKHLVRGSERYAEAGLRAETPFWRDGHAAHSDVLMKLHDSVSKLKGVTPDEMPADVRRRVIQHALREAAACEGTAMARAWERLADDVRAWYSTSEDGSPGIVTLDLEPAKAAREAKPGCIHCGQPAGGFTHCGLCTFVDGCEICMQARGDFAVKREPLSAAEMRERIEALAAKLEERADSDEALFERLENSHPPAAAAVLASMLQAREIAEQLRRMLK